MDAARPDSTYGQQDIRSLALSELEITEPGLYLDVVPANAWSFADLVVDLLDATA